MSSFKQKESLTEMIKKGELTTITEMIGEEE